MFSAAGQQADSVCDKTGNATYVIACKDCLLMYWCIRHLQLLAASLLFPSVTNMSIPVSRSAITQNILLTGE